MKNLLLDEVFGEGAPVSLSPEKDLDTAYDLIIAGFEINRRHGSGVLLLAIYKGQKNVAHLCTCRLHGGVNELSTREFYLEKKSRAEVFAEVQKLLSTIKIRSIMCVPCFLEEIWAAIAAQEISGAPLCTYVMDDPSLYRDARIPPQIFDECIQKSNFCLAISKEMAIAYETEFKKKFWVLPPVVDLTELTPREEAHLHSFQYRLEPGALVGNIWALDQRTFLYDLILDSGINIDWYCNGKVKFSRAEIQEAYAYGVHILDPVHPSKLGRILQDKPFILVPSGTTNKQGLEYPFDSVVKFSIPSRIPFIAAASGVPIIVLSNDTNGSAAARFVQENGIGFASSYQSDEFCEMIEMAMNPKIRQEIFLSSLVLREKLSSEGVVDWLTRSIQEGAAVHDRYEETVPV